MSLRGGTVTTTLILTEPARQAIEAESLRKLPFETGGALVGTTVEDTITIYAVIGPGPMAKHSTTGFTRDGDYAQQELDALVAASGGEWDYVAEWHSHTALVGPSSQDRRSMEAISRSPGYGAPQPFLVICCLGKKGQWFIKAYQFSNGKLVEARIAVEESPSS